MKDSFQKFGANIFTGDQLKAFLLKSNDKIRIPTIAILFNILWNSLSK